MAHRLLEDVLAINRDLTERLAQDPDVVSIDMIPDDHHGTVWVIHLRNGTSFWHGGGMFENVVPCEGGGYRVRPTRPQHIPVTPPIHDPPAIGDVENWIRHRNPKINDWSLEDDLVLYGLVQVGKTELILSMIWITQYVYEIPCLLVLANMTGSYNQVLNKNAAEFNDMLLEEFGEGVRPFFLKTVGCRGRSAGAELVEGDHTWLRVAMGNPAQIRRLINSTTGQFVLFCDEADVHVKGCSGDADTTSTGPLIKQLQEMALGSVKISATPFALWNQQDAFQKTLVMEKPDNYRGLLETEWVFSTDADSKEVRNGNVSIAVRILKNMVRDLRPRVENETRRYMTILVNGPSSIARQNALAQAIARRCPQWNAYVMNSDGGKSSIKRATRSHMVPTGRNTIAALYDMFESESGDVFQVNIIVACLTAARAISFRPTSRHRGIGGLHGMIFFPSPSCHAAQLIQFMRVWGKFDEDYPQIQVRTTQKAYDKLYSEITHNFPAFAGANFEMGNSREQIEGVHVVDVGLHDRRAVDDTVIEGKTSMLKREFETENMVREFLAGEFGNNITVMTERLVSVRRSDVEGGFQYGENIGGTSDGNRMTRKLKERLGAEVPTDHGFQTCWHKKRYEDHHTMTRRYGHTRSGDANYMSRVVAGSGDNDDDFVNVVVWKPEFSKHQNPMEEWNLDRFRNDRAYIFQTTKNMWRYYSPGEKRKCGVLSHQR